MKKLFPIIYLLCLFAYLGFYFYAFTHAEREVPTIAHNLKQAEGSFNADDPNETPGNRRNIAMDQIHLPSGPTEVRLDQESIYTLWKLAQPDYLVEALKGLAAGLPTAFIVAGFQWIFERRRRKKEEASAAKSRPDF